MNSHCIDRFVRRGFSECSFDYIPEKKRKTIKVLEVNQSNSKNGVKTQKIVAIKTQKAQEKT